MRIMEEITRDDVLLRVTRAINMFSSEDIRDSQDSLEDLGFNSLDILDLGMELQFEFSLGSDTDIKITKHSTPSTIADEVWKIIKDKTDARTAD